ncbi:MAG: type II toxin-antitoxin system VapC family toxin [Actinomycetota bacterium]
MTEERGLIDTSVAVDLATIERERLPAIVAVSALTLAELVVGPASAENELKRARRQQHLQYIEANVEPLPFESRCYRAYGPVYTAVLSAGRKARGPRAVDLMIAATALAYDLPLYTRNAKDLQGLGGLIEIVDVGA